MENVTFKSLCTLSCREFINILTYDHHYHHEKTLVLHDNSSSGEIIFRQKHKKHVFFITITFSLYNPYTAHNYNNLSNVHVYSPTCEKESSIFLDFMDSLKNNFKRFNCTLVHKRKKIAVF